jgi:hypothetical protein
MIALHKLIKIEPFSRMDFDWSKNEFTVLWFSTDWDEKAESKEAKINIDLFEKDLLEYFQGWVKDGCDAMESFFELKERVQHEIIVDHLINENLI